MKLGNYLFPHLNGSCSLAQLLTASLKRLVIVLIFVCKLDTEIACPLISPTSLSVVASLARWTCQITQSLGHYFGTVSRLFASSPSRCPNVRGGTMRYLLWSVFAIRPHSVHPSIFSVLLWLLRTLLRGIWNSSVPPNKQTNNVNKNPLRFHVQSINKS